MAESSPQTPHRAPDLEPRHAAPLVGVDVGATLVKVAVRDGDGRTAFDSSALDTLPELARRLRSREPARIGLTGCGAPQLARLLDSDTAQVNEFAAWASGAREMLRGDALAGKRFLLVSVGTGTSAMLIRGAEVQRIGGSALGGGTVVGLGSALLGTASFREIAALAEEGDRRHVDLQVSDIYREGQIPLPGDLNAASFAKLSRLPQGSRADPRDLAHAVMGLVGENVALICGGLAAAAQAEHIVFAGTTLRGNPALVRILEQTCGHFGRPVRVLSEGEFAGALGALELALA